MALNLLDSLTSTAASPEKSTFSINKKESKDGTSTDFSQMFSLLMGQPQAEGAEVSETTEAHLPGKAGRTGSKIATSTGTPTDDPTVGNATAMLAMAPAVHRASEAVIHDAPPLTAVVLSPNMTAITPRQAAPDSSSLVAFAQSQGLDKHVAAWLMGADSTGPAKTTPMPSAEAANTPLAEAPSTPLAEAASTLSTASANTPTTDTKTSLDNAAADTPLNPNAILLTSILATPTARVPSTAVTAPSAEQISPPIQLMPMSPPVAWQIQRNPSAGKATTATPAPPSANSQGTASMHSSDLDLSLIFAPGKDTVKSLPPADPSFTPAAWVMAGMNGNPSWTTAAVNATGTTKWIADTARADEGLTQASTEEGIPPVTGPGVAKASEPLATGGISTPKGLETGISTAERSELHQAQAEKMGQAIGQRMLSEMEKGHWHLKMMLKPANLGNVEVEMRLRNGELDANFTASQAVTRDLLQDGLPKLKDTLTQMGMDVASMHIGGGSSQKNGGDPTPQQPQHLASAAKSEPKEEQATVQSPQATSPDQDGLDVLV